jgi:hypothetical protein
MIQELIIVISEIIELSSLCDGQPKLEWFKEKLTKIQKLDIKSNEFNNEIEALNRVLAGMGSFDDLPLRPTKESGLSERQIRVKQTELAGKLGESIKRL